MTPPATAAVSRMLVVTWTPPHHLSSSPPLLTSSPPEYTPPHAALQYFYLQVKRADLQSAHTTRKGTGEAGAGPCYFLNLSYSQSFSERWTMQ